MATLELDPIFVRALKLLHSQAKDSADQLKVMLDEAFKLRQDQGSKSVSNIPGVKRLKEDTSDVSHMSRESKRIKLDSPKPFKSHTPSPTPSSRDSDTHSKKSEESKSDTDDDLAMEILEMGLTCVVCTGLEVGPRNQLIECQDCHSLYHQECHKPPVSEQDVNDPRVVWYCANCTKTMKKMQASKPAVKPGGRSSSLPSSTQSTPLTVKPAATKPDQSTQPTLFKRVETKSSLNTSNNPNQNRPVGMAALAASLKSGSKPLQSTSNKSSLLSGPSKFPPYTMSSVKALGGSSSSKSNSSSLSSPKPPPLPPPPASPSSNSSKSVTSTSGGSSIHYADKRLQNMKKKAAKMKEKRKMLK